MTPSLAQQTEKSFLSGVWWGYGVCLCVEQYPTEEDMIEWAKRESEREERERVARLTQQEQEDLELAIALSKSELSWPKLGYGTNSTPSHRGGEEEDL